MKEGINGALTWSGTDHFGCREYREEDNHAPHETGGIRRERGHSGVHWADVYEAGGVLAIAVLCCICTAFSMIVLAMKSSFAIRPHDMQITHSRTTFCRFR